MRVIQIHKYKLMFLILFLIIFINYNSNSNKLSLDKRQNIIDVVGSQDEYFLKEIFNASNDQLLIDKSILMKTISFMIQETDEFDPKLIEFVRSLIHVPSKEEQLNLKQPDRKDFSQLGQSKWVDRILEERRDGFFIEAGGYNGEDFSVNFISNI